jgi:hypothetical protein
LPEAPKNRRSEDTARLQSLAPRLGRASGADTWTICYAERQTL